MQGMVDRERERALLLEAAASPPALAVLIGRRRVGKSFLLARTLVGPRVISFQGDEQPERQQLDLLAAEIGRGLFGTDALRLESWDHAFRLLGEQARIAPIVLVLDEFQWLKASQPALDSILQRHWDEWDRERVPLTVVLTGSALTLMERLLDRSAPLFGCATVRARIAPLDFRDAVAFSDASDPVELLRRWAVIGGTPQYNVWAGRGGFEETVRAVLAKDRPLYDEPRHLLREDEGIRDPGTYLAVLRAIAGGSTTYNEIAQQAGVISPNLVRMLDRLENLGYIVPSSPLAADGPVQRTIYEIADPYFRFWLRYVARNRSRLERGRIDEVVDEVRADLDTFMGGAFEACCRDWLATHAPDELTGAPEQVGRWWSRDGRTEIDVVGVLRGRYVVVGSCKWRRTADTDVLGGLLEQQRVLGPKAAEARRFVFAREGFTKALVTRAEELDVQLVRVRDLYAERPA